MTEPLPDEHVARGIVQAITGRRVETIERFSTGLAHAVFDVVTVDQQAYALRLTRPSEASSFRGAVYWHALLRPRGVPLPDLIYTDVDGESFGYPVMLMERLPGADLGDVYPSLIREEKSALAARLAGIQRDVGSLPLGPGFGYALSYDDPTLHGSWFDVLLANLERSRVRIRQSGVVDQRVVDLVLGRLDAQRTYFDTIEPRCFLHDTTTKNMIIAEGALSGLVDVDTVCFGDVVQMVGLTQMALLSGGHDVDYIDDLKRELQLTAEQDRVLTLYTAMFCVDFLSEMGQRFNREEPIPIDVDVRDHRLQILDRLLS